MKDTPGHREYVVSSCEGKESMPAPVARRVAKRMTRKHKVALEPYRCDLCGGHHIGAQPRKAKP